MSDKLSQVVKELQEKYDISVSEQLTVTIKTEDILSFMQDLKDNYAFDFLTNLTAVDYPAPQGKSGQDDQAEDGGEKEDSGIMEVIYNINSTTELYTLMVKTQVSRQEPELPSVTPVWGAANFQEREIYDLLGIVFTGHPNLERILLDDKFEGHPLRRDFQWVGGRK